MPDARGMAHGRLPGALVCGHSHSHDRAGMLSGSCSTGAPFVSLARPMQKLTSTFILSAVLLVACGGSDKDSVSISTVFRGTLSGQQCFYGTPVSSQVSYNVRIDALQQGAAVSLVTADNQSWAGKMTTPSSFEVTGTASNADTRLKITGTNVTPAGIEVSDTTSCFSFRCCTTVTGRVAP
jgi:hypothetical protein